MVVVFWARLLPIRACMRLRPAAPSESPLPVYPSRGAVPGSAVNFQTFQRATFKRSSSPLPPLCLQSTINTCEPLQTVDAKRLARTLGFLESALTSHGQLIENTVTLSPLESTRTRFGAVTPLEATRTKRGEGGPLRGTSFFRGCAGNTWASASVKHTGASRRNLCSFWTRASLVCAIGPAGGWQAEFRRGGDETAMDAERALGGGHEAVGSDAAG